MTKLNEQTPFKQSYKKKNSEASMPYQAHYQSPYYPSDAVLRCDRPVIIPKETIGQSSM